MSEEEARRRYQEALTHAGRHPCVIEGCPNIVEYDDEPWCFTHSPDEGSFVPGYSYKREHP
jgi:hypothetical protein